MPITTTAETFTMSRNQIVNADCRDHLLQMPHHCVDCIVTSPPYWDQRDYKNIQQIGQERELDVYINELVDVFRAAKRVLKLHGTLWVNLGDRILHSQVQHIPVRFAMAMERDGWRNFTEIIWNKLRSLPNVGDGKRFSHNHEYVFGFTQSDEYFFDPVYEEFQSEDQQTLRAIADLRLGNVKMYSRFKQTVWDIVNAHIDVPHFAPFPEELVEYCILAGSPEFICTTCGQPRMRDYNLYKVDTRAGTGQLTGKKSRSDDDPYKTHHESETTRKRQITIRTYRGLTNCKCHGTYLRGLVLDPFSGSGTTSLVAHRLGRDYYGIELNSQYAVDSRKRLMPTQNLRLDQFVK